MAGKIQNEDLKTSAELVAAGATAASLPNDDKIYVKAALPGGSALNKTLNAAIAAGDFNNAFKIRGYDVTTTAPTNLKMLQYQTATSKWELIDTPSGGSGTPGGANTQVQFNNAGAFGGDSNFTWDNVNKRLGIGSDLSGINTNLYVWSSTATKIKATGGSGSAQGALFQMYNGTNNHNMGHVGAIVGSTDTDLGFWAGTSAGIKLFTNGNSTSKVNISSTGNVGFGITPSTNLHIYKDTATDASTIDLLRLERATTGGASKAGISTFISTRAASSILTHRTNPAGNYGTDLYFRTNDILQSGGTEALLTNRLILTSDGKSLFNTSSSRGSHMTIEGPYSDFSGGAAGTTSHLAVFSNSSTAGNGGQVSFGGITGNGVNIYTFGGIKGSKLTALGDADYKGELSFYATDAGGSLAKIGSVDGFGNLNACVGTGRLYLGGQNQIKSTTTNISMLTSNGGGLQISGFTSIAPNSDNTYTSGYTGQRWVSVWAVNGTIQTSDYRQKENIFDSQLGLDFVNRLRPVSYEWKDNKNGTHQGLIAQEVEQVLAGRDFAGLTNPKDYKEFYGLNYSEFIGPIIKAIQELDLKVETNKQGAKQ